MSVVVTRRTPEFRASAYGSLTLGSSPTAGQRTANTNTIQAAITAAQNSGSGGKVVFDWNGEVATDGGLTINGATQSVAVTIEGMGPIATTLSTNSGNLFTLTAASYLTVRDCRLISRSGGGHVFSCTTNISHALFENLRLKQENAAKAIYYHVGNDYIDNTWRHVDVEITASHTIAAWHIRSDAANRNLWSDIRPTHSGNYVWDIETTAVGSYANGNVIEHVTSEINAGGIVRLAGCDNTRLSDIGIYDLGTSTKDLISLDQSATGLNTGFTTLVNIQRHGFSLGVGLYDVNVNSGANHLFVNCGGITILQINAQGKRIDVWGSSNVTVSNDGATLYVTSKSAVQGIKFGTGAVWGAQPKGSKTWDPPSLASGAQQTTTVTVTGAALGDAAEASFDKDLAGTTLRAYVSAANTVTVVHRNDTGGAVDLASGTLRAVTRSIA